MTAIIQGAELRAIRYGVLVERATATLPQSTDGSLFTITGGRIIVTSIVGEVTTAIQNQLCNTKLKFNPSATGADQDLCAVLDIANDPVGEVYTLSGGVGDAMRSDLLIGNPILATPLLLSEGAIELDCSASNTGSVAWAITYVPYDGAASVAVA